MGVATDRLKGCALFKDFTSTGLGILAGIATERVVLAGRPLFTEGQASSSLFYLVEGKVKVSVKAPDGQSSAVGTLGPGEHVGELALLVAGGTRLCTATAETDTKVIEIKSDDFLNLQKQKPQACLKLMMAIAQEFGKKVSDNKDAFQKLLARR